MRNFFLSKFVLIGQVLCSIHLVGWIQYLLLTFIFLLALFCINQMGNLLFQHLLATAFAKRCVLFCRQEVVTNRKTNKYYCQTHIAMWKSSWAEITLIESRWIMRLYSSDLTGNRPMSTLFQSVFDDESGRL